jgi:hypothetical protein
LSPEKNRYIDNLVYMIVGAEVKKEKGFFSEAPISGGADSLL